MIYLKRELNKEPIIPYFKQHKAKEFIYVCPYTGGARKLHYGPWCKNC